MDALRLKDNLYWTGVLDPNLRVFDIVMHTEFGTTYNSYLLKGEGQTVLFESAKERFWDIFKSRVESVTPISNIDYLIVNHTEPDHSGSIAKLLDLNPTMKIVGTTAAIGFVKEIVNRSFESIIVKNNQTLTLAGKTLRFLQLPNLHWPDTMFTYVEEDRTLFTCDAFGCHFAHDGILRSTVGDEEGYLRAAKYYFDSILAPFIRPYLENAIKTVDTLDTDIICPGHGPVLDCGIDEILGLYKKWCGHTTPGERKTVIMPYVSAYGYTKLLADHIEKGILAAGGIDVEKYDMVTADHKTVTQEIRDADGLMLGTPTVLSEALPPIWELLNSMTPVTHGGKYAGAFGSYGWSGEAVPHITERLKQLKMKVSEGFRVRFRPTDADLENAFSYGLEFGNMILGKADKIN